MLEDMASLPEGSVCLKKEGQRVHHTNHSLWVPLTEPDISMSLTLNE